MFDLGWSELLIIAAVALIVIGPKDLPQAIRTVSQIVRKLRRMAHDFQSGLNDLAREAGIDEVKRDLQGFEQDYDPRAALESIADSDRGPSGATDDGDGKSPANRIESPRADERPDPPDLTPADFGAGEDPAGEDAAAHPTGRKPPDGGSA
jgi:sec-independent protein translocase protein TatB